MKKFSLFIHFLFITAQLFLFQCGPGIQSTSKKPSLPKEEPIVKITFSSDGKYVLLITSTSYKVMEITTQTILSSKIFPSKFLPEKNLKNAAWIDTNKFITFFPDNLVFTHSLNPKEYNPESDHLVYLPKEESLKFSALHVFPNQNAFIATKEQGGFLLCTNIKSMHEVPSTGQYPPGLCEEIPPFQASNSLIPIRLEDKKIKFIDFDKNSKVKICIYSVDTRGWSTSSGSLSEISNIDSYAISSDGSTIALVEKTDGPQESLQIHFFNTSTFQRISPSITVPTSFGKNQKFHFLTNSIFAFANSNQRLDFVDISREKIEISSIFYNDDLAKTNPQSITSFSIDPIDGKIWLATNDSRIEQHALPDSIVVAISEEQKKSATTGPHFLQNANQSPDTPENEKRLSISSKTYKGVIYPANISTSNRYEVDMNQDGTVTSVKDYRTGRILLKKPLKGTFITLQGNMLFMKEGLTLKTYPLSKRSLKMAQATNGELPFFRTSIPKQPQEATDFVATVSLGGKFAAITTIDSEKNPISSSFYNVSAGRLIPISLPSSTRVNLSSNRQILFEGYKNRTWVFLFSSDSKLTYYTMEPQKGRYSLVRIGEEQVSTEISEIRVKREKNQPLFSLKSQTWSPLSSLKGVAVKKDKPYRITKK